MEWGMYDVGFFQHNLGLWYTEAPGPVQYDTGIEKRLCNQRC